MPGPAAPRLAPLALPSLEDLGADLLDPDEVHEGQRITAPASALPLAWSGLRLRLCEVHLLETATLRAEGARMLDCRFPAPVVSTWRAVAGTWRGVEVAGGRIGHLDAAEGHWDRVALVGARIGYLSLRDADVTDLRVEDCQVETLDLTGATLGRVALPGSVVGEVVATRARLRDVDLRGCGVGRVVDIDGLAGAVITPAQLVELAPALAEALHVRVAPVARSGSVHGGAAPSAEPARSRSRGADS